MFILKDLLLEDRTGGSLLSLEARGERRPELKCITTVMAKQ
jgi:hypothetical protein